MSDPWVPPQPAHHLRVFIICLALVVLTLVGFLFGVRMEAVAPASGIITAREQQDIRALLSGLVELGWYEGKLTRPSSDVMTVRLDGQGDGSTNPFEGKPVAVHHYQLDGTKETLRTEDLRFRGLRAGDELWSGQVVAMIRPDQMRLQLAQVEERLLALEQRGEPSSKLAPVRSQRDRLRERLAQATLHVPDSGTPWQALDVRVAPFQAVQAGDVIATLVPLDPQTRQPRDLVARLDVDEKHFGDVAPGQTVRLYSTMYNYRLHGYAQACVERLEPLGDTASGGELRFHALAPITQTPFDLRLGSSFKAEIVVGRKPVYRIILEQ